MHAIKPVPLKSEYESMAGRLALVADIRALRGKHNCPPANFLSRNDLDSQVQVACGCFASANAHVRFRTADACWAAE